MFSGIDEMMAFIAESAIESVDLKITDLNGRWRHLTIPAAAFNRDVAEKGVGFDGSSVGFTRLESGDMLMKPDPAAAFLDPFHGRRTLGVICNLAHADTGAPYERDPRAVARRAEKHLASQKAADSSRWGPELEFYVFRRVEVRNDSCTYLAEIEPIRNPMQLVPLRKNSGYHACPPADLCSAVRERICAELIASGIPVKYHHHEVGELGQCEIEMPMGGLVESADRCQIIKYFARMCAHEAQATTTFMPKPLFGEAGSGMHFHQHLFRSGKPVFYDSGGYAGLSKVALAYVSGVLDHGRALTAFTNPSSNSFKRLVPGYEAPVNLFFSLANRSAAIRVPKYAVDPAEKRIEYRPPDATCNVYFAMAAMLMAGLDGVERELDPARTGCGPFDEDIFKWPPERRAQIVPLPRSLEEAVEALRRDEDFLLRGEVFTRELLDTYTNFKWETECSEILRRPHPFEFELYYDC